MTVDDRLPELKQACERLSAEPLWHASLGSKELFHSNLLGWAIQRWPDREREIFAVGTFARHTQRGSVSRCG